MATTSLTGGLPEDFAAAESIIHDVFGERAIDFIAYLSRPRCGTNAGYAKHLANGERTCDACKKAHAIYDKRQKDIAAERHATVRQIGKAKLRAWRNGDWEPSGYLKFGQITWSEDGRPTTTGTWNDTDEICFAVVIQDASIHRNRTLKRVDD